MNSMPAELWDLIPPEYQYVARDTGNQIWAYVKEPSYDKAWGCWNYLNGGNFETKSIKNPDIIQFFGNILSRDSLMKRPNNLQKENVQMGVNSMSVELWKLVPERCNYLAKDSNGRVWGYHYIPDFGISEGVWIVPNGDKDVTVIKNPEVVSYFKNISSKSSLVKRPTEKLKKDEESKVKYIVCKVEKNGSLRPNSTPTIHSSELSARAECERLAKGLIGTRFAYLKVIDSCISGSLNWDNGNKGE